MSLHSKPYFWVTCDHEGCDARSPSSDAGETDGITAWEDEEQATLSAGNSDWTQTDAGDFCDEHPVEEDES